jgi:sugar phosphate isomerase/epimerase
MLPRPTRRQFLAATATSAAYGAASRSTPIGMDSYTLRGFGWKAFELLDYAAKVGLAVVQFSEPTALGTYDEARDEGYLRRVREHADRLGVKIESGTWGVCPTNPSFQRWEKYGSPEDQIRLGIRQAKILGASSLRCVMGSGSLRTEDGPVEKHVEAMIKVLRNVREDALRAGIIVAPENHKDLRATEMRDLIEAAGREHVGVTLDTGNPLEVLEDPMETVEVLAPYAAASHFRDGVLWKHPRGAAYQWTAIGDGSLRMGEVVKRFVELRPDLPIILEIITGRAPAVLPYRDEAYLAQAFPNLTAQDLLRFDRLAEKGHPLMAGMMVPDNDPKNPAYLEAVKQQQRVDFERSINYLRQDIRI